MGIEKFDFKPKAEEGEEKKEITVKDVLADKKDSALFGEFLKSAPGGYGVPERMMKGEATSSDLELMAAQKDEFLKRKEQIGEFSGKLTPEFLRELAAQSPKIEVLMKLGGVGSIETAIKSQLEMLAMREPARFQSMINAVEQLTKKHEELNKRLEDKLKKCGISEEDYLRIIQGTKNGAERYNELKKLLEDTTARGGFGVWVRGEKKDFDIKRNAQIRGRIKELNNLSELENMRGQYETELREMGDILGTSVNQHAEMRKTFNDVLLGEKTSEEQLGGFKEMRGVMQSEEDLKKDWDAGWTDAQKAGTSRSDFESSFVSGKLGDKKGTWSQVVRQFLVSSLSKF
ncbi:MAG: hypothetical protein Q8R30_04370 [bacterium]|nr:hypothetical protein [bacterium]MDZ4285608.1 hypothetical protein [Candidatus Sungbacteria bacterium]